MKGVLDLLQKIVNSQRVSLIITMRGAVPPPGIVSVGRDGLVCPSSCAFARPCVHRFFPSVHAQPLEAKADVDTLHAQGYAGKA
jgi:hypothetical protein